METILVDYTESGCASVLPILKETIYVVPSNVFVLDAKTKKLLNVDRVTSSMADEVILIPKIAGG